MNHRHWPILVLGKMLPPPALRAEVELRSRALAARWLYAQAPCPILTFEAPLAGVARSGSNMVTDILRSAGLPDRDIVQRQQSTSTAEELQLASAWLRQNGYQGLRVVTSGYHIPRVGRKIKRLPWPTMVYSPEMVAASERSAVSTLIWAGQSTPDVIQTEHAEEFRWSIADRMARCLPPSVHVRLEIAAGRWWRRRLI